MKRLAKLPISLRIRAVRLSAGDVEELGAVQVREANAGDWLLRLPDGDFRICSDKTFRRDFGHCGAYP